MSTQDEYKKKSVHKVVDGNLNIKKVLIPHSLQVGRKTSSVNKDTVTKVSGSNVLATLTVRDDDQQWNRLEMNNGSATGGNSIKLCSGGDKKGEIYQYNSGDLTIRTHVRDLFLKAADDIFLDASDDIFFRPGLSLAMTMKDTGLVGIGTASPATELEVAGTITVDCDASETDYGLHIQRSGGSSADMIELENEDASATDASSWGLYHQDDGDFTIGTTRTDYKFHITTAGRIGVGVEDPGQAFHLEANATAAAIAKFDNTSTDNSADGIIIQCGPDAEASMGANNTFIFFKDGTGDTVGRIHSDAGGGGVTVANSFTGAHVSVMPSEDFKMGLIVESTGDLWANHMESVSTALPSVILSTAECSKCVYGVLTEKDSHPGMKKRWGVPEGKSQVYVNGLGEGKVWVTNKAGNIENGDYITTSTIPGHGMKQEDDNFKNYTVGKCVESVDWDSVVDVIIHNGEEYKKYLIGCTYHCS